MTFDFTVTGTPRPQGSMRVVRGRLIPASRHLATWRATVAKAAAIAWAGRVPLDEPVAVEAVVSIPRLRTMPASWGSRPRWATPWRHGSGDVDKHARALLDALTDAGVLADDSRVIHLTVSKLWAGDPAGLPEPGARIHVTTVPTTPQTPRTTERSP